MGGLVGASVVGVALVGLIVIVVSSGLWRPVPAAEPAWSGINTPDAGEVASSWTDPRPPSAENFADGVQPIVVADPSVPLPAFSPEEVTLSDVATFSVDLGNPNDNPNDGRPIMAEYQGYSILFINGTVVTIEGNAATGTPRFPEMALTGSQRIRLDGNPFAPVLIPLHGFGIGSVISFGSKVGELAKDGGIAIYDAGSDAAGWAGEQVSNGADVVWDGTKWVANRSVDAAVWVGEQVVDGGMWMWDGTKYVLVKTKNAGIWVWDESVKGGQWVYKKGEAVAEWIALHYDFEKVCGPRGEPGPGSGPDGTGATEYPKVGYQAPAGQEDFLELARAWMPFVKLSKDEKCGQVTRVVAKVLPYRNNSPINNLQDADRVEVVYTLFFTHDGGRWYGGVHPGDNEGFVIGLIPTDNATGRCGATGRHFQFYAGRTVKHKDVDVKPDIGKVLGTVTNEIIEFAGFVKEIEDFDWHDLGTSCPGTDDPAYSLWVAESKHATYFSHEECEKTMLGWEVAGMTFGGLEECEGGRPLSDLRGRVELWNATMESEPSPLHGKSYAETSRGNAENPSDYYHIPLLECPDFDTARAVPIRMTGIPSNTNWIVTVIGIDDFDPMIGVSGTPFLCNHDSDAASNFAIYGLPGYGDYSGSRRSAQINFNVVDGGERTFYVDSRDGKPGAFVAIFESSDGGIGISPAGDTDNIYVWGTEDGDMGVYVVAESGGLDLTLSNPATGLSSDDESAMSGLTLSTGLQTYLGSSDNPFLNLDLGGASGEREFVVGASGGTTGRYAIIVVGGNVPIEGLPPAPTIPVIHSVDGPSSIPADGQLYSFIVSFSDEGGDINRLVVNSVSGNWNSLDFNPMSHLQSGNGYSGTTIFSYRCNTGTSSLNDTLQIQLYDSAGNVSNAYSFPLACEGQSAPPPPPPPQTTHPPVITFVNGPSTITADSGRQYFYVSFTDADGDADRLVVKSDQGRWGTIDFGSPLPLDSGNSGNGVVSFYYTCSSSSSFSDTLRITIYDAAGNASNVYPFDLGCERSLQFPPQQFASHVSLTFPGGHGSIHKIGESAKLCYTFKDTYFGEGGVYEFYLYDFQPASSSSGGVDTSGPHKLLASGRADVGTYCFEGVISGPAGYEAFRIEIFQPALPTDIFIEFAELWIYVQP